VTFNTLYSEIEDVVRRNNLVALEHILENFSILVNLHKMTKSVHSAVYGTADGTMSEEAIEIRVVITGDSFWGTDGFQAGTLEEGWLYTSEPNQSLVDIGDIVEVKRGDNKVRRWKVMKVDSIGHTTNIFLRWRVSAIAD